MSAMLDKYITLREILDQLIRIRLKGCNRGHDAHFFRGISEAAPDPVQKGHSPADSYLPPRREWKRPPLEYRKECERDDVHRKAIHSAVMARMAKGALEETGWGSRLLDLVSEVRDAVSGAGDYRMQEPRIVFHKKADGGCRPIAVYDCLVNAVLK